MNIRQSIKKIWETITNKNTEKGYNELLYWQKRKATEGELFNDHYAYFYTDFFDLPYNTYQNKKIIDLGCGPRGSLEWANNTTERYGLDPLADSYLQLGADQHQMKYVNTGSENIPFEDNYFDVVCSFNSLDHVDDLDKTIAEIIRITKKGGHFLLISDLNHEPTECEPITFSFDIVEKFKPQFKVVSERHYEKVVNSIYDSIKQNVSYDHSNTKERYGITAIKFEKI